MRAIKIALCLLYYAGVMLTGAYYAQHRTSGMDRPSEHVEIAYVGLLWPIYWSARIAMKVTE